MPRDPRPLLVLGDSIVVGARDYGDLVTQLAADAWVAEVVAEQSRTVAWAVERVRERARVPAVVVVGLGSNPGPGLGTFPDEVAMLLDELRQRGARRVLWIPPHHIDADRYAERLEALRAIQDPRLLVADWPVVLDEHPEWFQGDGLHLNQTGVRALSAFIREQLDAVT